MGAMEALIGPINENHHSVEALLESEQVRLKTVNYGRVLKKISMDAVTKTLKCVSSISLLYERDDERDKVCFAKIYDNDDMDNVKIASWLGETVVDMNAGCALWFRNATSTTAIVWTAYGVGALPKDSIRDMYQHHFGQSIAGSILKEIDPAWLVAFVQQEKYIAAIQDALSENNHVPRSPGIE